MNYKQAEKELLLMAKLMDAYHLPFFLMQGTALGAYRDKGFTPTEEDIDFGFLQEHLTPKVPELVHHLTRAGFEVETYTQPFRIQRTIVARRNDVKFDLVGFMLWKDKRFCTRPIGPNKEPYSIVHPRKRMEEYDKVELFRRMFNAPSPIENYLRKEYGPEWRTPVKDHVSRTRVYDYVKDNKIPANHYG